MSDEAAMKIADGILWGFFWIALAIFCATPAEVEVNICEPLNAALEATPNDQ